MPRSMDYKDALCEVRRSLEVLAQRFNVSMTDVLGEYLVFTKSEIASLQDRGNRSVRSVQRTYTYDDFDDERSRNGSVVASNLLTTEDLQRFETLATKNINTFGNAKSATAAVVSATTKTPTPPTPVTTPAQSKSTTSPQTTSLTTGITPQAGGGATTQQASDFTFANGLRDVCFGVEMETLLNKRSNELIMDNAGKAMRDVVPTLNAKLESRNVVFRYFNYNDAKDDRAYNVWKITTDQSIRSEDGRSIFGLEYVSPKLKGLDGLEEVRTVCTEIERLGFTTNTSTALHIHVSCQTLTNEEIKRFTEYILVYEPVIDMFMTLPRRSDYSRYCRSNLKSVSFSKSPADALAKIRAVDVSRGINKLMRTVCPQLSTVRNSGRNHKVNYRLLKNTKHMDGGRRIEFRQHQGTVDYHEITAWIQLIIRFFYKTARMKPCQADEGNMENFWKIIDDEELKLFFTVRMESLPTTVDFTYETRELLAPDEPIVWSEDDEDYGPATVPPTPPESPQPQVSKAPVPPATPEPQKQMFSAPFRRTDQTQPPVPSIIKQDPVPPVVSNLPGKVPAPPPSEPTSHRPKTSSHPAPRPESPKSGGGLFEIVTPQSAPPPPQPSGGGGGLGAALTEEALRALEGSLSFNSHSSTRAVVPAPKSSKNTKLPLSVMLEIRLTQIGLQTLQGLCQVGNCVAPSWDFVPTNNINLGSAVKERRNHWLVAPYPGIQNGGILVSPVLNTHGELNEACDVAEAFCDAAGKAQGTFHAHVIVPQATNMIVQVFCEVFVRYEEVYRSIIPVDHLNSNCDAVRQTLRHSDQANINKVISALERLDVASGLQELNSTISPASYPPETYVVNISPCVEAPVGRKDRRIVFASSLLGDNEKCRNWMMLCATLVSRTMGFGPQDVARIVLNGRKSADALFFDEILASKELGKYYSSGA
eukprot:PhF_6_TR43106/c0_g1_i1/m.65872